MSGSTALWLIFSFVVGLVMLIDLGLMQKRAHAVSFKEAGYWCLLWLGLALAFCGAVHYVLGKEKALQFLTGYLLEESLSIDNMFVFVLIFHYFGIPRNLQSRVLHWGILGAIVMRFIFIFIGISLITAFHWMIYVFGLLLIFTGAKMATQNDEEHDLSKNPALKLLGKIMPLTKELKGQDFIVSGKNGIMATPMLAALIVVEFSDVIFALDSIPAILAVTQDTFVVYTSNIFAIMGLRSLFFLLSNLVGMFRYLKFGISLILVFVGAKMFLSHTVHISIGASLGVIAALLALSIIASVIAGPEVKKNDLSKNTPG